MLFANFIGNHLVDLGASLKPSSTVSLMLSISVARSEQTLLRLTNRAGQEVRLAKLTFTRGVFIRLFLFLVARFLYNS